jgi:hypothetical protein
MKLFNSAGPVNKEHHSCMDPLSRFDMYEIEMLIAQHK